jgi:GTP-binding protein
MIAAVERQSPPKTGLVRPKLRYAHQGGMNPPRVIIHGNALDRVPGSYQRYLEGYFRNEFKLVGTPLRIEFRSGRNPYVSGKPQRNRGKRAALKAQAEKKPPGRKPSRQPVARRARAGGA